jgi:hypothetical protein
METLRTKVDTKKVFSKILKAELIKDPDGRLLHFVLFFLQ